MVFCHQGGPPRRPAPDHNPAPRLSRMSPMPDRARKKEKQRLKRQKKRDALRRAKGVSPYKRIASAGELVACYMNDDWRERGQAVAFVLRRGPGGVLAMASFMIDLWCAGLKDAW